MKYVYVVYHEHGEESSTCIPFFEKIENAIKHAESEVKEAQIKVEKMKQLSLNAGIVKGNLDYHSFKQTGELQWVGGYKNNYKIYIGAVEVH